MPDLEIVSDYTPKGDQPTAIAELTEGVVRGDRFQTLLGATGTGKTFTVSHVIQNVQLPTLVMAPNKTLAAQLYHELKELFPHNAVEYFVSYYDYYQPEAYIPASDTFIEKDSSINDAIDRMRHAATRSLFERNDVIIVASVSCIYGLGSTEAYTEMLLFLEEGTQIRRKDILEKLVQIQYDRNDMDFFRGSFRVRGDVVEVFPAHSENRAVRIELFGDEVEALWEIDPLRGKKIEKLPKIAIYPNSHYLLPPGHKKSAIDSIRNELRDCLEELVGYGKLVEAQRLEQRTNFDLEMMATMGYCNGIENYSRHLSGRPPGAPPPTLLDYFPDDYLLVADESHVTIPQIGGMYRGDRSRKQTLIEHGFRLPSALDNRPLKFEEWEERLDRCILVSATPGDYEIEKCEGVVVEQIIRPTGLVDPEVEVRPALEQVDDLYGEIRQRIERNERVLVTTLTKRMSEDLTEYLKELGVRVAYLHSDIDTIERMNIIRDLRRGVFDVIVGINLLREGLDIPEVSLVGILDADKEGFLRSARSLIQTIGRTARNVSGKAILYADRITGGMREAIEETERRREIQIEHNREHGITPQTIRKKIHDLEEHIPGVENAGGGADASATDYTSGPGGGAALDMDAAEMEARIDELRGKMKEAAADLRFEDAATFRDQMRELENTLLGLQEAPF